MEANPIEVMRFTFSDTIAGYVTNFDWDKDTFGLKTADGRVFQVALTSTTVAEIMRNLGEAYADCTGQVRDMLVPNRHLFAYGVFYPQMGGYKFEAKHIVFVGTTLHDYPFEKPDWWVNQISQLADFYMRAEFPDGNIDFRNYRTKVELSGEKSTDYRQETDTISRLVYGFATAYLLTGEDRFLDVAEKGTEYLRDHMRFSDEGEGIVYWYHAIDVQGANERKIFASEFGDDFDALPAYEQIYALAGPVQTFRATGDPRILSDAEKTIAFFDRYYIDREKGGYFSHVDPITLDPRSDALKHNRARKNWNSVGDHAPAYLINLWLATGDEKFAQMLGYTADTIVEHFPDYEHSPFVQERFHEDWSHDHTWGWQQNRAVVGHNLKIAWNLMRINNLRPNERYTELAKKIAEVMPKAGSDQQRGGWYDVVERTLGEGEEAHRYVWHDRKAWWQQEQAILAYLILAGTLKEPQYLRTARESEAYYNSMFLDHDQGGVYFNVLAEGLPYLVGTERFKGSHSMSGYHSFELSYLAAVYNNLLITQAPMDLHFKPKSEGFRDNVLRVAPDILPPGTLHISEVSINGEPYKDFDADGLTVNLPPGDDLRVRVRIVPTSDVFNASLEMKDGVAEITLSGKLDDATAPSFRRQLDEAMAKQPRRLVLLVRNLQSISDSGIRVLLMARAKGGIGDSFDFYIVGAQGQVKEAFEQHEFSEDFHVVDKYDPATVGTA